MQCTLFLLHVELLLKYLQSRNNLSLWSASSNPKASKSQILSKENTHLLLIVNGNSSLPLQSLDILYAASAKMERMTLIGSNNLRVSNILPPILLDAQPWCIGCNKHIPGASSFFEFGSIFSYFMVCCKLLYLVLYHLVLRYSWFFILSWALVVLHTMNVCHFYSRDGNTPFIVTLKHLIWYCNLLKGAHWCPLVTLVSRASKNNASVFRRHRISIQFVQKAKNAPPKTSCKFKSLNKMIRNHPGRHCGNRMKGIDQQILRAKFYILIGGHLQVKAGFEIAERYEVYRMLSKLRIQFTCFLWWFGYSPCYVACANNENSSSGKDSPVLLTFKPKSSTQPPPLDYGLLSFPRKSLSSPEAKQISHLHAATMRWRIFFHVISSIA